MAMLQPSAVLCLGAVEAPTLVVSGALLCGMCAFLQHRLLCAGVCVCVPGMLRDVPEVLSDAPRVLPPALEHITSPVVDAPGALSDALGVHPPALEHVTSL